MTWTQLTNPLHYPGLSALVATSPIAFIFWALIIRKMKGYTVSLLTVLAGLLIAIFVYGMPVKLATLSVVDGALYGLFTICWIILGVLFLYNMTVITGEFEIMRKFMASVTTDRRLQAVLIAFAFGSFLEGAAGFGAPVAITASMLVGLGFEPLYAAGLCLIANTAPVAFGSIGIPITVASQVSGLPEMAISKMVGQTLPVISLILPFYLVYITAGWKRTREIWPVLLMAGGSFAIVQFVTSNYISPMLPDVLSGLVCIICLILFFRRKTVDGGRTTMGGLAYSHSRILRAWSPFIIMTALVILWGIPAIKDELNVLGQFKAFLPGLDAHAIRQADGHPLVIKPFTFSWLSNVGTAIFLAALFSMPLIGANGRMAIQALALTLRQLKIPALTIASVMGFAYVVNNSGMSITMALALATTGSLFPFFSPILGWLGVFLTGSDTSSNALFSKLQYSSAMSIGVNPAVTVGANVAGGVTGKMISPQSVAVGATAVGLVGRESDLFRFTVKHSFIMLAIVCILTTLQAYAAHFLHIFGL
ncbi:MAG: lactate permease [Sphingobacteriales bacterium 50-39]|nr:lactate permease LctP family transporter [Sphingobacteriales bacterium]OJW54757.1 MAG: lactate permease [Sphingobacteriales bacterium 50-39]